MIIRSYEVRDCGRVFDLGSARRHQVLQLATVRGPRTKIAGLCLVHAPDFDALEVIERASAPMPASFQELVRHKSQSHALLAGDVFVLRRAGREPLRYQVRGDLILTDLPPETTAAARRPAREPMLAWA